MTQAATHIVIEVYKAADYVKKTGQISMIFTNPANYSQSWDFSIGGREKAGGGNTEERLKKIKEAGLTLTFLVDGTVLASETPGPVDVKKKVWQFLETATILNQDNSRKADPPYCLLIWEDLCLKCLVEKVDLEISLVSRKGEWLRAFLTVSFRPLLPHKT